MIDFSANVPIYLQVVDIIKIQVMNGTLKPGDKISSVRELASEFAVNPNTVQRAFSQLEREGFIRTERAVGRYVADNQTLIDECRKKHIQDIVMQFIKDMEALGVQQDDILMSLKDEMKGEL